MKQKLPPNLGDLGEDDFKRWCTLCGLSAVKSSPDRMGWDFFVEFESTAAPNLPLDRQGDLLKVLVQVKATGRSLRSARGKLSAFKRFVDTDFPAFIVHVQYSGSSLFKASLLHIGPKQIEAILRRVRQAEKDGRTDLHNLSMSIRTDQAPSIELEGGNLKDLIQSIVGNVAGYPATKAEIRRRSGWDKDSIVAKISIPTDRGEEALVDLMIGSTSNMPFTEFVVTKRRFGIPLDNDVDRVLGGTVSIKPKARLQGIVRASSGEIGLHIEMPVEVFTPGMPWLAEDALKIRLSNEFANLIVHLGRKSCDFTYHVDPKKKYRLDELTRALRFGVAMSQSDSRLRAEINPAGSIDFTVSPDAKRYAHWRFIGELAELLSMALYRHRRGAQLELTLEEMHSIFMANQESFVVLTRPGLEMTCDAGENRSARLPARGSAFFPIVIEFMELCYFAIVNVPGAKVKRTGAGEIRFVGGNPQVLEDGIIAKGAFDLSVVGDRAHALSQIDRGKNSFVIVAGGTTAEPIASRLRPIPLDEVSAGGTA